MTFVVGTASTGTYCRPGCRAQPRSGHRAAFALPASAEAAGYRACWQCRPYRMPQTVLTRGPELVGRGVSMIGHGALDGGTEHDMAGRLGLSGRHLRRLFTAQLGVTPGELARSARVHFARRLLDDTELSMTEVAFTSGFGSVRQFNRDCKQVFRATPSQLRARRDVLPGADAAGGLSLRLWFAGPLDWEAMAAFLAGQAIPGVESVDNGTYRRAIEVDGDPGVIELSPGGPGHLLLRGHFPPGAGLMHLAAQARLIAGLDDDVTAAGRALRCDPVIGPLVRGRPGIRVPGAWDPFETGTAAIIRQYLTSHAAQAAMARLAAQLGREAPVLASFRLARAFPAARTVAAAGSGLAAAGLAPEPARVVAAFAAMVDRGAVRLDRYAGLGPLIASLTGIPGVTADAAHYLAWRLGDPDACPIAEPGLAPALRAVAPPGGPPPRRWADRWRPWRGYAVAHLWAASRRPWDAAARPALASPVRLGLSTR